jgi:dienelactone hydrolase
VVRAAIVTAVALSLLAPLGCGGDGPARTAAPSEEAEAAGDAGDPARVRTTEATIAGLRTVVTRPRGAGPWPLLVFVHGAGAPPEFYLGLMTDLAAEGNVVVAPAMPGSVDDSTFGALEVLPFQPGRASTVIDAVTSEPTALPHVDPERVAVLGHSMGGMTALAMGFNSCCLDSRVDAVVSFAGRLADFPGGSFGLGAVPALLVHGERDETVPFSASGEALQQVGTTAYLLAVEGGDHGRYLDPDRPVYPAVRAAVLAFLRATIGADPQGGVADLVTAGGRPGLRLTTRS